MRAGQQSASKSQLCGYITRDKRVLALRKAGKQQQPHRASPPPGRRKRLLRCFLWPQRRRYGACSAAWVRSAACENSLPSHNTGVCLVPVWDHRCDAECDCHNMSLEHSVIHTSEHTGWRLLETSDVSLQANCARCQSDEQSGIACRIILLCYLACVLLGSRAAGP